ncbi:hypothetical protein SD71_08555 [Cohnella kolymensis]|uniref:Uncharacterized protein n=1 Tax=Cohnella kolymensis TaxID=1590652 RepID=A0ABR5A6Y1_9BACL|nr:hypothetical protein SD71_08555 [Cohnella kolymensis]
MYFFPYAVRSNIKHPYLVIISFIKVREHNDFTLHHIDIQLILYAAIFDFIMRYALYIRLTLKTILRFIVDPYIAAIPITAKCLLSKNLPDQP